MSNWEEQQRAAEAWCAEAWGRAVNRYPDVPLYKFSKWFYEEVYKLDDDISAGRLRPQGAEDMHRRFAVRLDMRIEKETGILQAYRPDKPDDEGSQNIVRESSPVSEPLQASTDDAAIFELLAQVGCRMPKEAA